MTDLTDSTPLNKAASTPLPNVPDASLGTVSHTASTGSSARVGGATQLGQGLVSDLLGTSVPGATPSVVHSAPLTSNGLNTGSLLTSGNDLQGAFADSFNAPDLNMKAPEPDTLVTKHQGTITHPGEFNAAELHDVDVHLSADLPTVRVPVQSVIASALVFNKPLVNRYAESAVVRGLGNGVRNHVAGKSMANVARYEIRRGAVTTADELASAYVRRGIISSELNEAEIKGLEKAGARVAKRHAVPLAEEVGTHRLAAESINTGANRAGNAAVAKAAEKAAVDKVAVKGAEKAAATTAEKTAIKVGGKGLAKGIIAQAGKGTVRLGAASVGRLTTNRITAGVASKVAAKIASRSAAAVVPVVGWAISAAMWAQLACDSDVRNWAHHVTGGFLPWGAASVDDPPCPPDTYFLPLDSGRHVDVIVRNWDRQMVQINNSLGQFDPNRVWPVDGSALQSLSNYPRTLEQMKQAASAIDALAAKLSRVGGTSTDTLLEQAREYLSSTVGQLSTLGREGMAQVADAFSMAVIAQDNCYKQLLDINVRARQGIAGSSEGWFTFFDIQNEIDNDKMIDPTALFKQRLDDLEKANHALMYMVDETAYAPRDSLATVAKGDTASPHAALLSPKELTSVKAPAMDVSGGEGFNVPSMGAFSMPSMGGFDTGGEFEMPESEAVDEPHSRSTASSNISDLLSKLTGDDEKKPTATSTETVAPGMFPIVPGSGIGSRPGLGGSSQITPNTPTSPGVTAPKLDAALPKITAPTVSTPTAPTITAPSLKAPSLGGLGGGVSGGLSGAGLTGETLKVPSAPSTDTDFTKGLGGLKDAPGASGKDITESKSGDLGKPEAMKAEASSDKLDAPGKATSVREVEVQGTKVKLATPEAAAMTDGVNRGVPLRQAAAQAGYQLPDSGQDIGTPISPMDMAAGDVVISQQGEGVVLDGGKVLIEGRVLDGSELSFDGEHQGIFRLDTPTGDAAMHDAVVQVSAPTVDTNAAPAASAPASGDFGAEDLFGSLTRGGGAFPSGGSGSNDRRDNSLFGTLPQAPTVTPFPEAKASPVKKIPTGD